MFFGTTFIIVAFRTSQGTLISCVIPAGAINTTVTCLQHLHLVLYAQLPPLLAIREPHTSQWGAIFLPLMLAFTLRTRAIFFLKGLHSLSSGLGFFWADSINSL